LFVSGKDGISALRLQRTLPLTLVANTGVIGFTATACVR